MQRTALGAAEVPEVNSNAHRASTSGSAEPSSFAPSRAGARPPPRALARATLQRPADRRSSAKRSETRTPPGRSTTSDGRIELRLVPWFGDHELHVGMHDVASEMLPMPGVVQPGDGSTGQTGAAQREDIVGRVVEQDTDMRRAVRIEAGPEERGKALRLGQELGVGPDPVAEAKRRPIGVALDRCRSGAAATRRSEPGAAPRPAVGRRSAALRRASPQHTERAARPPAGARPTAAGSRLRMAIRDATPTDG